MRRTIEAPIALHNCQLSCSGSKKCATIEIRKIRRTYSRPVPKIPATPSFFFMLILRLHIALTGNTNMLTSLSKLITLVTSIRAPVSKHLPGSDGLKIFARGTHAKMKAKKIVVYTMKLSAMSIHDAQKIELRCFGGTNMRCICMRRAIFARIMNGGYVIWTMLMYLRGCQ